MVDINKVVDINLSIVKGDTSKTTNYGTTLYFVPAYYASQSVSAKSKLYTSYSDIVKDSVAFSGIDVDLLLKNVYQYFINGGKKLVICPINDYSVNGFMKIISEVKQNIASDFIFVIISALCLGENKFDGEGTRASVSSICKTIEGLSAPNKIRLCVTTNNNKFIDDELKEYNLAVKYSTTSYKENLIDAALLIGAYFSQVYLDEYSSIKDYCYTREQLYDVSNDNGICNITNDEYDALIEKNYNFIEKIGNNIVNFGGNYANGIDIVTDFGAIALENDIVYQVLNVMIDKQYLNDNGLTNIVSAINSVLLKYIDNGYMQTKSVFSGNDYEYIYNGKKFKIIKNGDVLENGFKVYAIPIANISKDDYKARKFPPIIIVIETNHGARIISINGVIM